MQIYEDECIAAGVDISAVKSMARKLAALSREMDKHGVYLFGGSGSGTIRANDSNPRPLILAHVGQGFDGGAGDCNDYGPDGLMRGE